MSCRVCRHWRGPNHTEGPDKGECRRHPTPIEVMSNYRCGDCSVSISDASNWWFGEKWEREERAKLKQELKQALATLERVRARNRSLKAKQP